MSNLNLLGNFSLISTFLISRKKVLVNVVAIVCPMSKPPNMNNTD